MYLYKHWLAISIVVVNMIVLLWYRKWLCKVHRCTVYTQLLPLVMTWPLFQTNIKNSSLLAKCCMYMHKYLSFQICKTMSIHKEVYMYMYMYVYIWPHKFNTVLILKWWVTHKYSINISGSSTINPISSNKVTNKQINLCSSKSS